MNISALGLDICNKKPDLNVQSFLSCELLNSILSIGFVRNSR
ncbi:hypothetical protein XBI1_1570113 [Xenorhabdus bovienii str. Intermedium]|uniref:Uncharacterized protein n=1 Tax=Xenorhabdus bovienii str. Intermedium TaxID=1379677 RepID=A0A077QDW7_XENBV|nr:hypothetical protein XBI1_1570113 [Xenorhabdus bovienii str. Intermedium]